MRCGVVGLEIRKEIAGLLLRRQHVAGVLIVVFLDIFRRRVTYQVGHLIRVIVRVRHVSAKKMLARRWVTSPDTKAGGGVVADAVGNRGAPRHPRRHPTRETRAPTRARDERDERLRLPLKKGEDNKDEFLNRSLQTISRFHCALSMMKIQV